MNTRRGLKRIVLSLSIVIGILCGVMAAVLYDESMSSNEVYFRELESKLSRIESAMNFLSDEDNPNGDIFDVMSIILLLETECNVNNATADYVMKDRVSIRNTFNNLLQEGRWELAKSEEKIPPFIAFLLWFVIASIGAFLCSWAVLWWGGNLGYLFFRWIVLGFKSE